MKIVWTESKDDDGFPMLTGSVQRDRAMFGCVARIEKPNDPQYIEWLKGKITEALNEKPEPSPTIKFR